MKAQRPNPTGAQVAAYLGRVNDPVFTEQCSGIVTDVRDLAESYTRGIGFTDDNTLPADICVAVVSRSARVAMNPLSYASESVDTAASQDRWAGDWSRGERRVLDVYRKRST
jgi:hypothetical protein